MAGNGGRPAGEGSTNAANHAPGFGKPAPCARGPWRVPVGLAMLPRRILAAVTPTWKDFVSERLACAACGRPFSIAALRRRARMDRLRFLMRAGRAVSQEAAARALGVRQSTVARDMRALGASRRASAAWALPRRPRTRRGGA